MRHVIALVILCFVFWPRAAGADVIAADGVSFTLEVPRGYCALSRSHEAEKPHYDMQDRLQATSNGVLLIAVHCSEKDAMRAGQPWQRWVIWLLNGPPGKHTRLPPGMTRDAVVAELAKALPSVDLGQVTNDVNAGAKKEGLALQLKTMSIVAKEASALYTAQAANVENGTVKRDIAIVTGWAGIAGRLVTVNTYADYKNAGTVEELLKEAREALQGAMKATDAAGSR